MKIPESSVQSAIVDYLRANGFYVIEYARPGTHRRLRGVLPTGHPDLLAIKGGKHIWVEVKAPGGKPTPEQIGFLFEMAKLGDMPCVFDSLEACAAEMQRLGLGQGLE